MKNMKKWKRLMAVGMCSAMVFSMSVGVSATENQDMEETTVVETEKDEESIAEGEDVLKGDSGVSTNVNDESVQIDEGMLGEAEEKKSDPESEPEPVAEIAETQENSEELPIVEWNNNFTVSHGKGNVVGYSVELGDEWKLITANSGKEPSNFKKYINGALMDSGVVYGEYIFSTSFESQDVMGEAIEITYEIDRLEHYSNGKADGIAKDVRISFKTEVEESEGKPYVLPTVLDYDGTQELVFKFKDGTGDHAIKEITKVVFCADSGMSFWVGDAGSFTYDIDAGTVTVKRQVVNNAMNQNPFQSIRG